MSVPESERGENKLEVFVLAKKLCEYTIQVCSNPNVFDVQYKEYITDDMVRFSKGIFLKIWTANNVYVNKSIKEENKAAFEYRIKLQKEAILECNKLLSLLDVASTLFHLKTKRVKHWGEMILKVKMLIDAWSKSDKQRLNSL